MSKEGLLVAWRRRLAGFVPGTLTVSQWCDSQGISEHQYYYWRRRLADADKDRKEDGRWLAVDVIGHTPPPSTPGGVAVRIGSATIELQPGFDPAMLRAVVRALETPQC